MFVLDHQRTCLAEDGKVALLPARLVYIRFVRHSSLLVLVVGDEVKRVKSNTKR